MKSSLWLDSSIPLAVAGYSMGSVLAFEMVRHLESFYSYSCVQLLQITPYLEISAFEDIMQPDCVSAQIDDKQIIDIFASVKLSEHVVKQLNVIKSDEKRRAAYRMAFNRKLINLFIIYLLLLFITINICFFRNFIAF